MGTGGEGLRRYGGRRGGQGRQASWGFVRQVDGPGIRHEGCLRESKSFESVGVEGGKTAGLLRSVDEQDLQRSVVDGAVDVFAEVGVLESVLVGDMDAMVGDKYCKMVHRIWVGAKERGK